MKRCWIALATLALSVFLAMPAGAIQVTDDQGTVLNLVKPPQRIVSLLPSLTETVCALGQCSVPWHTRSMAA
jgi:iron complex transport system substrate-binding protein